MVSCPVRADVDGDVKLEEAPDLSDLRIRAFLKAEVRDLGRLKKMLTLRTLAEISAGRGRAMDGEREIPRPVVALIAAEFARMLDAESPEDEIASQGEIGLGMLEKGMFAAVSGDVQ